MCLLSTDCSFNERGKKGSNEKKQGEEVVIKDMN